MGRRIQPDEEGYLYFAKSEHVIYGPYSRRSTAQGVATQMTPWGIQNEFRYETQPGSFHALRVPNPAYSPGRVLRVFKVKVGAFVPAPYESLQDKYQRAIQKLERITQMLNDRGIDVEFD
jgi:hypothetical protein